MGRLAVVCALLSVLGCIKAPSVWVDPSGDGIITDEEEIKELKEDGYVNNKQRK